MTRIARIATAGLLAAGLAASPAIAAAPDLLEPEPAAVATEYELDTVLIVHNWILCVSEASAETLAMAHRAGRDAAAQVYAELAAAKTCGRFARLGVMLKTPLYRSGPGQERESRVFAALVNIGVGWQDAFVVAGMSD